jgi:hypothetical protein
LRAVLRVAAVKRLTDRSGGWAVRGLSKREGLY